ncbi:MAG TPA: hypothetical protein VLZ83_03920 [Edaphocola sp.]|nr:hypothetical protein [Edaphocola sp.]
MPKNKNILKDQPNLEDKLWQYIEGNLSPEESFELEYEQMDDPFWDDAVEGLKSSIDKKSIVELHGQLKQSIREKTNKVKNKRKQNFVFPGMVAVFMVLLIVVIAFLLIRFFF